MSSSGTNSNGSAKYREHNHGQQDRKYTSEQEAAVERIRRCKATAYYKILALEKSATESQIKKAYHKLSLQTHPDKNGAPGADEAFKLVSKAFQILSDPQKRKIFDHTGSDPDSRAPSMPTASGNFAAAGGGGGPFFQGGAGADITPEELFNMFFGGGMGGTGGPFDMGGGGFAFGGPGIRVHQFGGSGPRMRQRHTARRAAAQEAEAAEETPAASFSRMFYQLLPLILLFLFPVLSGLFGSGAENAGPRFSTEPSHPFTQMRVTPNYKIPFWVNPADIDGLEMREVTKLGNRAEAAIINQYNIACTREEMARQQKLQDAHGFFYTDHAALKKAREMDMPSCKKLQELGAPRKRVY